MLAKRMVIRLLIIVAIVLVAMFIFVLAFEDNASDAISSPTIVSGVPMPTSLL